MSQHLIDRPATAAQCRCGQLVLTAIVGGLTTVTDIQPLTIDEEIAALLTCRATFDLQSIGTQVYLQWRDVTRIRAGRNHPVVGIHQCGPGTRLQPLPVPAAVQLPDDPPF